MVAQAEPAAESVASDTASQGITLRLSFPGHRYHATPWGHHVNEGLIEWPPSPWRILRALLATGYTKLHWDAGEPPTVARTLIEKLCTKLPRYRLPRAVGTHSRHYMPQGRLDKGREQTSLVLDTWAHVDDDWLGVHWDVDLNEPELSVLGELVHHLGYLGRSESWVEGELTPVDSLDEFDVLSGDFDQRPGPGWEQVALLAPEEPQRYAIWREASANRDRAKLPQKNAKGKALTKAQLTMQAESVEGAYPLDIIACLQIDTRFLQDLGWSQPPGTRKVFYWRKTDVLSTVPALADGAPPNLSQPEFVLLALATENNNMGNLPLSARTLPQGELLHRALVSQFPEGNVPCVLSGRDLTGKPLRNSEAHLHAHILHLDLDGDQHLDHILLWARMRFDASALGAIRAVRHEVAKKAKRPHRVAVAAMGGKRDLLALRFGSALRLPERLQLLLGGVTGVTEWISVTPFIPPRFLKPSGKNSLEGQIRAELAVRGFSDPVSVEVLDTNHGHDNDRELARKGRHFIRCRSKGGNPPPIDCGFMLRLQFAEPTPGPILLGYGCHFGMGAFEGVLR